MDMNSQEKKHDSKQKCSISNRGFILEYDVRYTNCLCKELNVFILRNNRQSVCVM